MRRSKVTSYKEESSESEDELAGVKGTTKRKVESDSDSDGYQDKPQNGLSKPKPRAKKVQKMESDDDSDDDAPLSELGKRGRAAKASPKAKAAPKAKAEESDSSDDDIPLSEIKKKSVAKVKKQVDSDDSDSDTPLSALKGRKKATPRKATPKKTTPKKRAKPEDGSKTPRVKKKTKLEQIKDEVFAWWDAESDPLPDGHKWRTLHHNGIVFPPAYKPHGIKMFYDGKAVDLTPEQEEVATFYATMLETDYAKKPQFNKNFFKGFQKVLYPRGTPAKEKIITSLSKCDFTRIHAWVVKTRDERKARSKEEKQAEKEEKEKVKAKYGFALVDGRKEKIANFNMEPPGLFRGRGEHPKMGFIKPRVGPNCVTLNLSKDAPVPPSPIAGQKWKEIVHKPTVTWLAFWPDPVMGDNKYVFLGASSRFKGEKDLAKYEKARQLKGCIANIRKDYTTALKSKDMATAQLGTAMWVIDHLALRVGNEKNTEEEADTVGCCSLRKEHIKLLGDNKIRMQFLGKDSIEYVRVHELDAHVYKNFDRFLCGKKASEDVFDLLNTTRLNKHLGSLMPGLSAKVFRTYNASATLEKCLLDLAEKVDDTEVLAEKLQMYNMANREVAILCNHQKAAPKNFDDQMDKMDGKIQIVEEDLEQAELEYEQLKKIVRGKQKTVQIKVRVKVEKKTSPSKKDSKDSANSTTPVKPEFEYKMKRQENTYTVEQAKKRLEMSKKKVERITLRIATLKSQKATKRDQKTVALGTSKINYCDPRITVSWSKRHQVPIQRVFNNSLLEKFPWAFQDPKIDAKWRF